MKGTKPQKKSVKLSREYWLKASHIGGGNMAEGIRKSLESWPNTPDPWPVDPYDNLEN